MNLLLIKYNNYYNRIIKKEDTLSDYQTAVGDNYSYIPNINFNPNNGVNTQQVLNWQENWDPDYLIAFDDNDVIISRWFITRWNRLRTKQYNADLYRDTVADNYTDVINAPMYIEKATISSNDIAIYNKEDINFNEIKQSEDLLKDKTGTPWIVGYMAPNYSTGENPIIIDSIEYPSHGTYSSLDAFYQDIGYNGAAWKTFKSLNKFELGVDMRPHANTAINHWVIETITRTANTFSPIAPLFNFKFNFNDIKKSKDTRTGWALKIINSLNVKKEAIIEKILLDNTEIKTSTPMDYNNIYIYVGSGSNFTPYKITVSEVSETTTENIEATSNSNTYLFVRNSLATDFDNFSWDLDLGTDHMIYKYKYTTYTITATAVSVKGYKISIPPTVNKLLDAPYKMFAMPLDSVNFRIGAAASPIATPSRYESLNIATRMAMELGTNLYDLQLLPYCPFQELYHNAVGAFVFVASTSKDLYDRVYINDENNTKVGFILFPRASSFTFDFNKEISLPYNVIDMKVVNQCDKYRLCSPNYSAMFEFNPVKTGKIKKFNVDCTYKPYSPYIHVNPIWSNLYGQDFDDMRGLVCQGDFSLPVLTDQWKQYEINNKNYLNAFNRQIENMEVNNKLNLKEQRWSATAGVISGASSGAFTGGITGIGAGIGAAAGAGMSLAGGIADTQILKQRQAETLDYTKDLFNYSIQNIQALPNTLAKISSFDKNNKLFPILEYYSCLDDEKQAFKDKMTYNGMTVNRIGTIAEFLQPDRSYIKGQLIRLETVNDEIAIAISNELYKGVYI